MVCPVHAYLCLYTTQWKDVSLLVSLCVYLCLYTCWRISREHWGILGRLSRHSDVTSPLVPGWGLRSVGCHTDQSNADLRNCCYSLAVTFSLSEWVSVCLYVLVWTPSKKKKKKHESDDATSQWAVSDGFRAEECVTAATKDKCGASGIRNVATNTVVSQWFVPSCPFSFKTLSAVSFHPPPPHTHTHIHFPSLWCILVSGVLCFSSQGREESGPGSKLTICRTLLEPGTRSNTSTPSLLLLLLHFCSSSPLFGFSWSLEHCCHFFGLFTPAAHQFSQSASTPVLPFCLSVFTHFASLSL